MHSCFINAPCHDESRLVDACTVLNMQQVVFAHLALQVQLITPFFSGEKLGA